MTSEDVILYDVSLSTGTRVTRPSILIVSGSARVVVFGPWVNVDSEAELLTLCESLIDPLVVMPRKPGNILSESLRMTGFSSGLNTQAPLLGSLRTYLRSDLIPLPYAYVPARAAASSLERSPQKSITPGRARILTYTSRMLSASCETSIRPDRPQIKWQCVRAS